jgi:hypothetical protein
LCRLEQKGEFMGEENVSGSSRRDVLKATGAAAVGAAAFFAAANALGDEAGAVVDSHGVTHYPTTIVMKVDGVTVSKVHSFGPITKSYDVQTVVDSSGVRRFERGVSRASQAQVTRVYDGSSAFHSWFQGDTSSGASRQSSRQVTLELRGRHNSTIGVMSMVNAWPSSWSGPTWNVPQNTPAKFTETVTLVCDSWKLS